MKELLRIVSLLAALTGIGTAWFWLVEGWAFLDAVYMTVITLSTVGYSEIHPLSSWGKLFVIVFLAVGLGVFLFGTVQLGEVVVRAELRQWWRERGMSEELKSLRDHFIVCGAGRMGWMLCEHLQSSNVPFVAIDRDDQVVEECREQGWPAVDGDATDDRTLTEAGIDRAKGVAVSLSNDADNLFVVLSARLASRDLRIVARATDENGVKKMERAGADRVVSLYESGAVKMGQLLTNPKLDDFFEIVSREGITIDMAETQVPVDSPLVGKQLSETNFREQGVMVVAIRRADGEIALPPSSSTKIAAGDELFTIGKGRAVVDLDP